MPDFAFNSQRLSQFTLQLPGVGKAEASLRFLMEGEFVAKPRMFCVNTFWFRNAGTSPVREVGIFAKGEMSLSRNPWGLDPSPGSLHLGAEDDQTG